MTDADLCPLKKA